MATSNGGIGVTATIDLTGLAETAAELAQMVRRASDLTKVLAGPVTTLLQQEIDKQFKSEGAYFGTPWAPLTPVTRQLRQNPNGKIGRETWRLYNSLTARNADAIVQAGPQSLVRDTVLPYAKFFAEGWYFSQIFGRKVKNPRQIAARPIVPDSAAAVLAGPVCAILENYITTGRQYPAKP